MAPRPTHHKPGLSLSASIDLDVEGGAGGRLDEDYDAGWRAADVPWSAKGPASYAPRMSFKESALAHLGWARAGWWDANRWNEAWRLTKRSSDVRNGVLKGLVLSTAVLAMIFFFEVAFFPSHLFKRDKSDHDYDEKVGHFFFLYPLLGLCYFLASSWTVDVAQATYKLRGGGVTMGHLRGLSTSVSNLPAGTSRKLLEESYRVLLLINYTLVYFALLYVPWLGRPLAFAYMSFIDAYYCHEQALIARGWSLDRRMRYCESRWAYFIAFGIPSTLVSFLHPSPLVGIVVFMICFPIYSVLATISSPQPRIAPTSGSATTPTSAGGSLSAELSLFLPPRLPIFWPTIKAHRLLLRAFPPPVERSAPLASSGRWGTSNNGMGMGQYNNGRSDMRYNAPPMHGATGVDHGPGSTAGRRSAAQVVGGAWNYNTNASPRLGGSPAMGGTTNAAAPPLHGFSASNGGAYGAPPQANGAAPGLAAPSQAPLPPPPKGPAKGGKKRD